MLAPDCKYRYGESSRRFVPEEGPSHRTSPARIWKSKTFEGNRTASCCVNVRFADGGGTRAPMDKGRSRPGADAAALSGIGCNSLLRSPINSPDLTRSAMLAALARPARKTTAWFRPLLHPGAKGLLLLRSSSIARGPRGPRELPRFINSCRPLTDRQPIPNGEI